MVQLLPPSTSWHRIRISIPSARCNRSTRCRCRIFYILLLLMACWRLIRPMPQLLLLLLGGHKPSNLLLVLGLCLLLVLLL